MSSYFDYVKQKYNMNISGVVHIGAHYGQEIDVYILNEIKNMMLFEPLSENYKVLCNKCEYLNSNFCDVNIKTYNVALGSSHGRGEMYVSDNEGLSSSLLKPKVHITHHPSVHFTKIEEVEIDVLDNYDCKLYNYLCVDVQGYELEVFKGAIKTLENIDYIYCEVNRDELYEGNAYVEEIDKFLLNYKIKRVETNWIGELWGDALYIKNY